MNVKCVQFNKGQKRRNF